MESENNICEKFICIWHIIALLGYIKANCLGSLFKIQVFDNVSSYTCMFKCGFFSIWESPTMLMKFRWTSLWVICWVNGIMIVSKSVFLCTPVELSVSWLSLSLFSHVYICDERIPYWSGFYFRGENIAVGLQSDFIL